MKFNELGLGKNILKALESLGLEEATEVQEKTIPFVLEKRDVFVRSQTGSGKTFAFVLPLLEKIEKGLLFPQILIVCPTRELASQASGEVKKITTHMEGVKIATIFGGADIKRQIKTLKNKPDIVVGTPGRILDHLSRKTLKLHFLKTVVLDEADEMLNMGFKEDIEKILKNSPETRQTLLFSATYPDKIKDIVENYLLDYESIQIGEENKSLSNIYQSYVLVNKNKKREALFEILKSNKNSKFLVFSNTKAMTEMLAEKLTGFGYFAEAIHGDLKQGQRRTVLENFRFGKTKILVASDVAARGLHVNDIDYVINYDIPYNLEYFLHRMGRTARAGKKGNAITIVTTTKQLEMLEGYENETQSSIKEIKLKGFDFDEKIQEKERTSQRNNNFARGRQLRKASKEKSNFDKKPREDRKPREDKKFDRKPREDKRERKFEDKNFDRKSKRNSEKLQENKKPSKKGLKNYNKDKSSGRKNTKFGKGGEKSPRAKTNFGRNKKGRKR